MVYVVFADAELVTITHLRAALGADVGHVCSELPGPDDFAGLLPIVHVVRLPSPPKPHRFALDAARVAVTVHVPVFDGRPAAIQLAGRVLAHLADMAGRTVGGTTVSTVRDLSGPEVDDDDNEDSIKAMGTALVLLRPPTS